MKEKVMSFLELYGSFTEQVKFAQEKIREIIQWSWVSKDMGVITNEEHADIYGYAIDMLVKLENY